MAEITNINNAWHGHLGSEVRGIIQRTMNEKVAATYFDSTEMKLYGFKSVEDRDKYLSDGNASLIIDTCPFSFSGTLNRIVIENKMPSTQLYFTTNSTKAEITVGFISQEKGITDTMWQEKIEDFLVTVAIDKGATGSYTNIKSDELVLNGNTLTLDIRNELISGANRLKITAKGKDSGVTASLVYVVNLTSMYLSPSNFAWQTPFVEGTTYALGGMNIGGAIPKVLKIKVTGDSYEKLYEDNIGTSTYITSAYFFKGLEFPATGVFNVELWLDANGLESDHLSYNIICVSSADQFTAQLVCVNEYTDTIINYQGNNLFKYAIYNSATSSGNPYVKLSSVIDGVDTIISEQTLSNIPTGSAQTFTTNIEIESESTNLQVVADVAYGNTESLTYIVDNSASYPATPNATHYWNAAQRSNGQANRESIVDSITKKEYLATWENMAWTDGTDGWTVDDSGRKCLRIPAGSKATLNDYLFLKTFGGSKTIEINFKVNNIASYTEPIISIAENPETSTFRGIVVYPDKVIVHSRDLNKSDMTQSYPFKENEVNNLIVTITRNYKTNYGNIAIIYMNGVKKCEFAFSSTDSWSTSAPIILGNADSDLFVYSMRMYDTAFGWQDAIKNFINSLPTTEQRVAAYNLINSVIDDSYNIDYDAVKGKYNTMTVEMLNGAELPHYGLSKEYSAKCNLNIDILDEDADKKPISGNYLNQKIEGQGTTSMNYWLWNLRWKMDYMRITAKKNWASSMQSHKMGATEAFDALHKQLGLDNEAGGRVAVYQYPVYGFQKIKIDGTSSYTYKFIGMYTIGPDKGDKGTFGYNNSAYKNTVIHCEGTDHSVKGVGMDYPYSELKYVADEESLCVDRGNGQYDAAWEIGASGSAETESEIQSYLDEEFKPAYNVAYDNSTMIIGTDESLETINADVDAWGLRKDENGHAYQRYEFWINGEYDLYYLSKKTNQYEKNGTNLLTQLGISESEITSLTITEKNELFKSKRRELFKANMNNYWHLDDCLFCYVFLLIFGATDNHKKNSYPYKFGLLSSGSRWRWRQDDLDTLFDIDNQGHSAKTYSIEVDDWTDDAKTAYVFKGEDSVFWTLIRECFELEINTMGQKVLSAMYELSDSGTTTMEKMLGFFKKYFWNKAQDYFTKSCYNVDAEQGYEEAWYNYNQGKYDVDVHPLEQSLGDHYEAERDWVEKRLVYIMSKFKFGPFIASGYNDTSLGRVTFRSQLAQSVELTPAIDLYPVALTGQSSTHSSNSRVKAGNSVVLSGVGGNNTNIYIMAADYLKSLGDLSQISIDSESGATLAVASKRLQDLKVGDENADNVTSNLQTLNITNCPSLTVIDARNLVSLNGVVDLTNCPRLREALFGGTSVSQVILPNGSKISKLQLPDTITVLSLENLKFLSAEGLEYGSLGDVQFFRVENCDAVDSFEVLKSLYNAENSPLKDIRIIGFAYDGDATDIDMLSNLATDIDKDGNIHEYNGIDSDGIPQIEMLPVIEGVLNVDGYIYEDTESVVRKLYPNLTINVSGGYYVRFADAEVQRILSEKIGDGVGVTSEQVEGSYNGSTFVGWFKNNTLIETFDELERFTGLLYGCLLEGLTNLKSIKLIKTGPITNVAVTKCTSLESITIPKEYTSMPNLKEDTSLKTIIFEEGSQLQSISGGRLTNCSSLEELIMPDTVTSMYGGSGGAASGLGTGLTNLKTIKFSKNLKAAGYFANSTAMTYLEFPEGVETIATIQQCANLSEVKLPSTLKKIEYCFLNCPNLQTMNFPESIVSLDLSGLSNNTLSNVDTIHLPNLETITERGFGRINIKKVTSLGKITSLGSTGNSQTSGFSYCPVLTSVVLPETLTYIGSRCFQQCYELTEVNIPKSVTVIYDYAFAQCTKLSLDVSSLPTGITFIGTYAFHTDSLVTGELNLPNLTSISSTAFYDTGITKVVNLGQITELPHSCFFMCKSLTEVTLPNTLVSIVQSAFNTCRALTNIVIPEGVTTIGYAAFQNCDSLTSCILPKSITTLDSNIFYNCGSLSIDVDLPNLESIGENVFYPVSGASRLLDLGKITAFPASVCKYMRGCTLIILPPTVESMGANCMLDCPLEAFICLAEVPPTLETNALLNNSLKGYMYVPDGSLEAYKSATGWLDYVDYIKPLSDLQVDNPDLYEEIKDRIS